ncbi:Uncharacterised protein [Sphingobacterium daejeonense]|nr:Uncharacterised protein [Sphingobacterium daejeonense]
MKKLILLISMLGISTFKAYSQDVLNPPLIDGVVTYTETISTDLNKSQI